MTFWAITENVTIKVKTAAVATSLATFGKIGQHFYSSSRSHCQFALLIWVQSSELSILQVGESDAKLTHFLWVQKKVLDGNTLRRKKFRKRPFAEWGGGRKNRRKILRKRNRKMEKRRQSWLDEANKRLQNNQKVCSEHRFCRT